jgi:hypothetical protein
MDAPMRRTRLLILAGRAGTKPPPRLPAPEQAKASSVSAQEGLGLVMIEASSREGNRQ